ncbi:hypothetical protein ACD582_19955 [Xanthomonas nasturtii]|uniref:hypothetical protein n=1 Tax=Xanthomonas nasturtii TaxID=1843581 RepID=UPI003557CA1C
MLNELTKNLPDGVGEAVDAGIAAGLGAAVGGSAGAATAFNSDTNNRQLHPSKVKFLKSDEVVEKYIDYTAENGLILTEEGERVRLNRFAASKEEESWATLNGTDAFADAFLVNALEGRNYTHSMGGAMHSFRIPDPAVNLNALYGSRFDSSIKSYIDNFRGPNYAPSQANKELLSLETIFGCDAAGKQANFGGGSCPLGKRCFWGWALLPLAVIGIRSAL